MSVLGLSLLIASFSFFCYRCPPLSWPVTRWLRRPSPALESKKSLHDAAPSIELSDEDTVEKKSQKSDEDRTIESNIPQLAKEADATKQELDRKAMPPPPPPLLKKPPPPTPNSPPTPRASQAPSFTLVDSPVEPSVPSFPALNSAQRASNGARGAPRLNATPTLRPQANGSTSLLPHRSPLPNRGPPSLSSSLAPPPTHTTIPTKPRRKVLLTAGHSPLDWAHLSSSPSANLNGLPAGTPYLRVPPSLLKQYTGRKGKDAWTVLGGKVYNITPYMPYHPGGEPELMKAAGRDGSRLFGEVHPWVNWEGMLEACLVGIAVEEGDIKPQDRLEALD